MLAIFATSLAAPPRKTTHSSPTIQRLEDKFNNQLHQSWVVPDKPSKYPRKGEYPCKGSVCRTPLGKPTCDDCQDKIPIEII